MRDVRVFESGASRDSAEDKLDFEGYMHPLVMVEFGKYMKRNETMLDGSKRESDNWQKGIPKDSAIKSAYRHFIDWQLEHRGCESREGLIDALCGVIFNVNSYLLTVLKEGKV